MRRSFTLLTVMAVVAFLVTVPVRGSVGAVPSTPQTVDFGIVGPDAISEWIGLSLTPTTMVSLSTEVKIFLGFRSDMTGLEARATAVTDPSSPLYGQYESLQRTIDRFSASEDQVRTVVDWFAERDVDVMPDATRTFAFVTMTLDVLQQMTGTTFGAYTIDGLPPEAIFVTPTTTITTVIPELLPSIDRVYGATFPLVTGLAPTSTRGLPRPAVASVTPAVAAYVPADGGTPTRTGTPSDACPDALALEDAGQPVGISPGQLRTAYGVDELWERGLRGRGARISVVDYSAYEHSDLDEWRSCFGLEGTPITDHVLGPLYDDPVYRLETTLDLQTVVSFAPEAERIDWFGVPANAPTMLGSLIELLAPAFDISRTDGVQPDVVTVSYAVCEANIIFTDPGHEVGASLFGQLVALGAASGIGTFVASGDTGSTGCFPTAYDVSPTFPSTSAWVTAVGGTNITLDAQNHIVSAGVWNDARMVSPAPPADAPYMASGGGLSSMVARQPWQPVIGDGTARPVPDVSLFADVQPGYFLLLEGNWMQIGGTSVAAPALAAMTAIQSGGLAEVGRPRLGFVAPLLHSLATSSDPSVASIVVDVVLGTNDAHDVGMYDATPGFDLATGIGWIRQDALHDHLHRVAPSPVDPVVPVFTG